MAEDFHSLFSRRGGTSGASDGVVVHPGRDAMLVGAGQLDGSYLKLFCILSLSSFSLLFL